MPDSPEIMKSSKRKNLRRKKEESSQSEDEAVAVDSIVNIGRYSNKKRKAGIAASALNKVEKTVKENSLGLLIDFNTQEVVVPMAQSKGVQPSSKIIQVKLNKTSSASTTADTATPAIYFPKKAEGSSENAQKQIHHHRTIDYSRFEKRAFQIKPK
jgi:hypothetical protein